MKNYIRVDSRIKCKTGDLDVCAPVIRVNKAFDDDMVDAFSNSFNRALDRNPSIIPIVIDSYGGEVYCLLEMISLIKSSPVPVATICNGKAMSCGAILASFGAEGLRFMDPDATVMIHDVSSRAFGKVEELKADASEADRLNKKVFTMMARNCGKPDDFFLKKIHDKGHADWFLGADESIEVGLVNFKRVPEMTIKVTVDIDVA